MNPPGPSPHVSSPAQEPPNEYRQYLHWWCLLTPVLVFLLLSGGTINAATTDALSRSGNESGTSVGWTAWAVSVLALGLLAIEIFQAAAYSRRKSTHRDD